jgi:hypothetical protein
MDLALSSIRSLMPPVQDDMLDYQDPISFACEVSALAIAIEQFDDVTAAIESVNRVKAFVDKNGCTKELMVVCGEELEAIGVQLVGAKAQDVSVSLEATASKFSLENIKRVLLRIIDAIVQIYQKVVDRNKKDANALKEVLLKTLVGSAKFDVEKFTGSYITAYNKDAFLKMTGVLKTLDLVRDIKGGDTLDKALPDTLKGLISMAGWKIDGDRIVRNEEPTIKRARASELGWKIEHLTPAARASLETLEHLRTNARKFKGETSKIVDGLKGNAAEYAQAKNRLRVVGEYVPFAERLSLILSAQILSIVGSLKIKTS